MTDLPLRRVYATAFACEPERGSEPGVGYKFAEALAHLSIDSTMQITLLTRPHTVAAVRQSISATVGPHNLTILPLSLPMWLVGMTGRKHVRLAYIFWQFKAVCKISSLSRHFSGPYVVHHITFATEALPTFQRLLGRRAIRVFGPAGSSQQLNSFDGGRLRFYIRTFVRGIFGRTNLSSTSLAIASNDYAADHFRRLGAAQIDIEPNIVVPPSLVESATARADTDEFPYCEFICVGLLRELKRTHWALEGLALMDDPNCRLMIVGKGPEEAFLRMRAKELGIADRVVFAGRQSRESTLALMCRARVLVHPSRQESSGWVIGEAQALGILPLVVARSGAETAVRLGGFGLVADNSVDSLARSMREALETHVTATGRWSDDRLPGMMREWYARAWEYRAIEEGLI